MPINPTYSSEPENQVEFTAEFDSFYTRFARIYDWMVRYLPIWRTWLKRTLPYIQGDRVLEVRVPHGRHGDQELAGQEAAVGHGGQVTVGGPGGPLVSAAGPRASSADQRWSGL